MAKAKPSESTSVLPAPSNVPLGVSINTPATNAINQPEDLCGKTVSLNMAMYGWYQLPVSRAMITAEEPTFTIPAKGLITKPDLVVLFGLLKDGKLIFGDTPIPRFVKSEDTLMKYVDNYRGFTGANIDPIRNQIIEIVKGPYQVGGYNKVEILEHLLRFEKGEIKGKNSGLRRSKVISIIDDAIRHVQYGWQGGVSGVKRSQEDKATVPSSSNRNMSYREGIDHSKFLESDI